MFSRRLHHLLILCIPVCNVVGLYRKDKCPTQSWLQSCDWYGMRDYIVNSSDCTDQCTEDQSAPPAIHGKSDPSTWTFDEMRYACCDVTSLWAENVCFKHINYTMDTCCWSQYVHTNAFDVLWTKLKDIRGETPEKQYDYIVVGAGSGGLVAASRIAAAAPSLDVLLLDAGELPPVQFDHGHSQSRYNIRNHNNDIAKVSKWWMYDEASDHGIVRESDEEFSAPRRNFPVVRGKIVGGSTAINGRVYTRGSLDAYPWPAQDVLTAFRSLEIIEPSQIQELDGQIDPSLHGPIPARAALPEGLFPESGVDGHDGDSPLPGFYPTLVAPALHELQTVASGIWAVLWGPLKSIFGIDWRRDPFHHSDQESIMSGYWKFAGCPSSRGPECESLIEKSPPGSTPFRPSLSAYSSVIGEPKKRGGLKNLDVVTRTITSNILGRQDNPLAAWGVEAYEMGKNNYVGAADPLLLLTQDRNNPKSKMNYFLKDGGEIILAAGALGTPMILARSGLPEFEEGPLYTSWAFEVSMNLPGMPCAAPWYEQIKGFSQASYVRAANNSDGLADIKLSFSERCMETSKESSVEIVATSVFLRLNSKSKVRLQSINPLVPGDVHLENPLNDKENADKIYDFLQTLRDIFFTACGQLPIMNGGQVIDCRLNPGHIAAFEWTGKEDVLEWAAQNIQPHYHYVGTAAHGIDHSTLQVHGVTGVRVADASALPSPVGGNTDGPVRVVGHMAARFALQKALDDGRIQKHSGRSSSWLGEEHTTNTSLIQYIEQEDDESYQEKRKILSKVETRNIGYDIHGKTVNIPLYGIGTGNAWRDSPLAATIVSDFLMVGGRLIDTAWTYWNYGGVGLALRESNVPREEMFIVGKVARTYLGYDRTKAVIQDMLRTMGLDYFDLILIHWPGIPKPLHLATERGIQPPECASERVDESGEPLNANFSECRIGSYRALQEVYKQGLARQIGVSNFEVKHLEELRQHFPDHLPAVNQIEFNPLSYSKEVPEYCKQHNIHLMGFGSFGGARRADDFTSQEIFKQFAERHNKTASQVVLRWAVQQNVTVMPATSKIERMVSNGDIFDFKLEQEFIDELNSYGHPGQRLYPPHPSVIA